MSGKLRAIPLHHLRECFDYDDLTGKMTWRIRPQHHFASRQQMETINALWAGQPAGELTPDGTLTVTMSCFGAVWHIPVHRIAWALVTGAWPTMTIHHVNGDRTDNHWGNLRHGPTALARHR